MSKKKQALLSEAQKLFQQFGFQKVTVEEICRKAHTSKVTFYKHFKNKQALVMELVQNLNAEMITQEQAIINAPEPFEQRFQALFQLHLEKVKDMGSPFLEDLMNPQNPEIYQTICAADQQSMANALTFFRQGQAAGVLNSQMPEEMFMILLDMAQEWVQDPRFIAIAPDMSQRLEMIFHQLFYGIQRRP